MPLKLQCEIYDVNNTWKQAGGISLEREKTSPGTKRLDVERKEHGVPESFFQFKQWDVDRWRAGAAKGLPAAFLRQE